MKIPVLQKPEKSSSVGHGIPENPACVPNHPIRLPRTHTRAFRSSKDFAAYYGIPEILPPARTISTLHQSAESPLIDFQTLSSNYLSMLSRNPSDNTNMTDPVAPISASVSLEELCAPVIPDNDVDSDIVESLLATMHGTESSLDFSITVSSLHGSSPSRRPA